jgi:hypothetical protein
LGLLLTLAGCNIVGAVLYKVSPPPKTPARYKPVQETAVIYIENSRNRGANEIDNEQLARLLGDELRANKVVPLVADNAVNQLRDRDPAAFAKMTVPEIGRAVGAKQVIYVDLSRIFIDVDDTDQMVRGEMDASVRIIDARTGQNRWPEDAQQGWPVSFSTPFAPLASGTTEAGYRRKMHEAMAQRISHLFYDWQDDNSASQFGHEQ